MHGQPPELQNLYPVTITILDNGQPIQGVLVTLAAKVQREGIWSCNGITDGNGVVKVQTKIRSLVGDGAKSGTYTVVLSKDVSIPTELTREGSSDPAVDAKRTEFIEKNRVIPPIFGTDQTSPIELTVEDKKGATLTVDVAKYRL